MQLKSITIGRLTTKNNVFLAPLAGYSDICFREICLSLGAGLTFTEMVSAKGLVYNGEATKALLETSNNEIIKAAQIFGSEPEIMVKAVNLPILDNYDIIDVNMGCPVPKVYNNGEGSALLNNPLLAERIVKALAQNTNKTITVKMRTGVNKESINAVSIAKAVENAGAKMITIHARTREDYYSGEIDYETVKAVKKAVSIPVIANGGIYTLQDANIMMEKTEADGIMLARGAMYAPWIFSELTGGKAVDKKKLVFTHLDMELKRYPDKFVAVNMRKQLACYLKNVKNGKLAKTKILTANSVNEIKQILNSIEF